MNDDDNSIYSKWVESFIQPQSKNTMWRVFDESDEDKGKKMKKCKVNMPDGNGKVSVDKNSFFITPTHTGFMMFTNPTGLDIEIHSFVEWNQVVAFMKENSIFDLTHDRIADSL